VRVEAALASVGVFQTVEFDVALPHADRAKATDAPRIAQQLVLNGEPVLAVAVDDESRPALTKLRVDIVIP